MTDNGWTNQATFDLWAFLVSYRENKPMVIAMADAARHGDNPLVVLLATKCLARYENSTLECAVSGVETVNWEEINSHMRSLEFDLDSIY